MTRETYDKIKGHTVTQSDAERVRRNIEKLESYGYRLPINAADLESPSPDLAQSDAEPVAWQVERTRVALGKIAQICRDSVADMPQSTSDAEPVAWQWRIPGEDWPELSCGKDHAEYMRSRGAEIRPVFASPHPDTSAGLIEANARLRAQLNEWLEWDADSDRVPRPPNETRARPNASAGLIEAAEIVETEEEPAAGELPPELIKAVLNGDTVTVERAIIAAVRATKKSIESRIRARAADRRGE